jgi:hypothetical protein
MWYVEQIRELILLSYIIRLKVFVLALSQAGN